MPGGGDMPLWLTGHSLGGAYAAALTVHLLVNHAQHAQLFAGGGCAPVDALISAHCLAARLSHATVTRTHKQLQHQVAV